MGIIIDNLGRGQAVQVIVTVSGRFSQLVGGTVFNPGDVAHAVIIIA